MALLSSCAQAQQFARNFRGADPEVLAAEVNKLHDECPGTVSITVMGGRTVHCECPCHQANGSKKKPTQA